MTLNTYVVPHLRVQPLRTPSGERLLHVTPEENLLRRKQLTQNLIIHTQKKSPHFSSLWKNPIAGYQFSSRVMLEMDLAQKLILYLKTHTGDWSNLYCAFSRDFRHIVLLSLHCKIISGIFKQKRGRHGREKREIQRAFRLPWWVYGNLSSLSLSAVRRVLLQRSKDLAPFTYLIYMCISVHCQES